MKTRKKSNKKTTRIIRGIFLTFLGSLSFLLTGCYAPFIEPQICMYSPFWSNKTIKGEIKSAFSTSTNISDATISASHTINGQQCDHLTKSEGNGSYLVKLDCLDGILAEDNIVTLQVSAENYLTATDSVIFYKNTEYKTINKDFLLEDK